MVPVILLRATPVLPSAVAVTLSLGCADAAVPSEERGAGWWQRALLGSLPTPCYTKGIKGGATASASGSEAPNSERTSQLRLPVLLAARRSSCGVGTVEGSSPCVPSSVLRSWLERGGSVVRDKPFQTQGT